MRLSACSAGARAAAILLLAGCIGVRAQTGAPEATDTGYMQQIQQAQADLQAGSAERALSSAEGAILSNPERWDGYAVAGRALLVMKHYEQAADAFSKAIERAPEGEQGALRALRRQSLLTEAADAAAGQPSAAPPSAAAAPAAPATGVAPAFAARAEPQTAPVAAQAPVAAPAPAPVTAPVAAAATPASTVRTPIRSANRIVATDAIWIDADGGLMWARPWRYPKMSTGPWNFQQAQAFCTALKFLGYADWRLPTISELQRVYLPSSSRWSWSEPEFEPAYGVADALRHGLWRLGSFTTGGDTFTGNRLLLWSSTAGDEPGTHAAVFFGHRYDMDDSRNVGTKLPGVRGRTPFRAYGLCVRTAGDLNALR